MTAMFRTPLVRDDEGYGEHEDLMLIPSYKKAHDEESEMYDFKEGLASIGWDVSIISMLDDLEHEHHLYKSYFEDGNTDISGWRPGSYSDQDRLILVGADEESPYAIFARIKP